MEIGLFTLIYNSSFSFLLLSLREADPAVSRTNASTISIAAPTSIVCQNTSRSRETQIADDHLRNFEGHLMSVFAKTSILGGGHAENTYLIYITMFA